MPGPDILLIPAKAANVAPMPLSRPACASSNLASLMDIYAWVLMPNHFHLLLNLLRAGLVKDLRELYQCFWSGHSALAGRIAREWQDCDYVLSLCKKHGILLSEICSGSRRHEIAEARRIESWIAVRELGYSGVDVARYLGINTSCINRSVASGKRPKAAEYLK